MAFAVGNRARVKLSSAALAVGTLQPQPPLLGLVTQVSGSNITVTFAGAAPALVVDAAFLDQIEDALLATRQAWLNKVVLPTAYTDPGYTGRVVNVTLVDTVATALVRCLSNGLYYEMPVTLLTVLEDR